MPKIDGRTLEDIVNEIKRFTPYYIPELDLSHNSGVEWAIIQIFASMHKNVVDRLNKAPEKNFIEFLELIGIKLLPSQPAIAPITFTLSEGTSEHVLIPERTQIAAGDIIFETKKNIIATPSNLNGLFSVTPEDDRIFEHLSELNTGEIINLFNENKDKQEHILYLGDTNQFNIAKKALIYLEIEPAEMIYKLQRDKIWQYCTYKNPDTKEIEWVKLDVSTENYKDKNGKIINVLTLLKDSEEQIEEVEINGIKNRWIRCIVDNGKIDDFKDIFIDSVGIIIKFLENDGIGLDSAFYNNVPLDLSDLSTNPIYPFGKKPMPHDTFYIACKDAFSKKRVNLKFTIVGTNPNGNPLPDPDISWEYWDGSSWNSIKIEEDGNNPFEYHDDQLNQNPIFNGNEYFIPYLNIGFLPKSIISGEYVDKFQNYSKVTGTFNVANFSGMVPTKVNGKENYWLRIRLAGGEYGKEVIIEDNTVSKGTVGYPQFEYFKIFYETDIQDVDKVLTFNGLEYNEIGSEYESFKPFNSIDDEYRTFYLGFNKKVEKGPISIFFSIEEENETFDKSNAVIWEYYSVNDEWIRLDVNDETRGFTRTGTVEFVFPLDFKISRKFGMENYWIRALNKDDLKPKIENIFLNTTWAIQTQKIENEILGSSDGTKNQTYNLAKNLIVIEELWINEIKTISEEEKQRIKEKKELEIKEIKDEKGNLTEFWVKWDLTEDLLTSKSYDRHYEMDKISGKLEFGNGIYGKIPPIGKDNIMVSYQIGGGSSGNKLAFEIKDLKSSIPFVDKAFNPLSSSGGDDVEIIENSMDRSPQRLKNRDRAVTAEDFEQITYQTSRAIARVKCLENTGNNWQYDPGWVTVLVIPFSSEKKPQISLELKREIENYLLERSSNLISLKVAEPVYVDVAISASVIVKDLDLMPDTEKEIISRLTKFLNPIWGNYDNKGWEFGKIPCISDFYALLEKINEVDYVDDISVKLKSNGNESIFNLNSASEIKIPPYSLIYSGEHKISLRGGES